MTRIVNWVLIALGTIAAGALTVEGTLRTGALSTELLSLLCVVAAVPPVIAAIRMESARKIEATTSVVVTEAQRLGDRIAGEIGALGDRLEKALAVTSQAHADQMKRAVADHGALVSKHETVLEKMGEIMNDAADNLTRDMDRWAGPDSGPFPSLRKLF